MKHKPSADKLIEEMEALTNTLRQEQWDNSYFWLEQVAQKTGDVLGALEVFTFANFNDAEQETIFTRAKVNIEKQKSNEPVTER